MVYLVVLGDHDPMVFAPDLAPVQLARKGGDVRVWSVTICHKEVWFGCLLLIGGNNIPRVDLGDHSFYRMVFVPYAVLLEFLDVLRINGRDDGFDRHQVGHILEGIILPLKFMVLLEFEELATLGTVRNSWVE